MHFRTLWALAVLVCHIVGSCTAATNSSIYQPCQDQSALCFGFPENCVSSTNCQLLFLSQFEEGSGFHLQMIAPSVQQDQYIAVGFSDISLMSGLVVQCFKSSKADHSTIEYSFNDKPPKKRHNNQIANQSDVSGFSDAKSSYANKQLQCEWQVKLPSKVHYQDQVYDFDQSKYFLQLAIGPFKPADNKIHYHDESRVSSSLAISLKSNGTIHPSGSSMAVRWHASLMIFGWIGCMTVAILMARFTRDLWPDQKLFGQKYWFVFHRYLMITGWLAIVVSYVIIFVQYKGWSKTSAHSVIGMVAGILATLQIGNSFLRPAPDSKSRWIFDYAHWFMGNSAHLLALANIINSGLKRSTSFFWLLIAYLFVYLLFSDLLRKLESRVRHSYSATRAAAVFQLAVLIAVGIIVGIVTALVAIMFVKG